jgi:transposase-like protein
MTEENGMVYEGMYSCPKCASRHTGTSTIATSGRWIEFVCHDCGKWFSRSSEKTSSLSKLLRKMSDESNLFIKSME